MTYHQTAGAELVSSGKKPTIARYNNERGQMKQEKERERERKRGKIREGGRKERVER